MVRATLSKSGGSNAVHHVATPICQPHLPPLPHHCLEGRGFAVVCSLLVGVT
jgi:hypothetical protein